MYERGPNKNFKTHRKINTPDFLPFHNVPRYRYTCNILNYCPPFSPPRCRRSIADRISRNRYLRGENYAASTGRRCFNRAARSRGACETEALRTIRLIYRVDDTPPSSLLPISSIGIVHPIDRVIEQDISVTPTPGPSYEPHLFLSTFFVLAISTSSILQIRFIPYSCISIHSKNISIK